MSHSQPTVKYTQAWAHSEALKEFKSEAKAQLAVQALNTAANYKPPVGWNLNDNPERYRKDLARYMDLNYSPEPVGFFLTPIIGTWLLNQFISIVVSWAVNKIIQMIFSQKE